LYRGYVASNEIGRLNIEFYNMQKFRMRWSCFMSC